jgi:hypothetical protein
MAKSQSQAHEPRLIVKNQGRSVYHLPVYERSHGPKSPLRSVRSRTVVIGDSMDRVLPPGIERNKRCPSPDVALSSDDWRAIGRAGRDLVRTLEAQGELEVVGDMDLEEDDDLPAAVRA